MTRYDVGNYHWCIAEECKHGSLNGSLTLGNMLLKSYNDGYTVGRDHALQDLELMKEIVNCARIAYDCAPDDPICFKGTIDHLMTLMRQWGDRPL